VIKIMQNLKISQDRQKRYVESKMTHKEFKVGDHVHIRVNPKRSSLRMGVCAKLSPHYCGTFEVLERVGLVANIISLSPTVISHMCSMYMY
jgi:hypothetical protein